MVQLMLQLSWLVVFNESPVYQKKKKNLDTRGKSHIAQPHHFVLLQHKIYNGASALCWSAIN